MLVNGELRRLEEDITLDKKFKQDISVVIDRLVMRPDLRKRLADSVETAVARADGLVDIQDADTGDTVTFSEQFACLNCGTSMPELEPRMFSFNSPHGACPRCTGLGSQMEIDPELIVPDPSLSLGEGAILPWSTSASNYYEQMTQAIAEKWEIDMETPWEDLSEEVRDTFLYGTNGDKIYVSYRNRYGRRRSYMTRFEGILQQPRAALPRDRLRLLPREDRGVHVGAAVPGVQGRAAAAREPRRAGGRAGAARAHRQVGAAHDRVVRRARPHRHRARDRSAGAA